MPCNANTFPEYRANNVLVTRASTPPHAEFDALPVAFCCRLHHGFVMNLAKILPKWTRAMDSIFIERLWRSFKWEEVYLNAYESMPRARQRVRAWTDFYYQSLNARTRASA